MLFGAMAFCVTPPYTTLQTAFAGRLFSEKVVSASKFAVIVPLPETETFVLCEFGLATVILPAYDQLPNAKFGFAAVLIG